MRKKTIHFLILTVVTGLVGFGLNFTGVEAIRFLFLIFADLLIVSLFAKLFFSASGNMQLERIKK